MRLFLQVQFSIFDTGTGGLQLGILEEVGILTIQSALSAGKNKFGFIAELIQPAKFLKAKQLNRFKFLYSSATRILFWAKN